MVFMRATLSSFNIKFRSFGNLRQNRPLSFVSRIILSLVELNKNKISLFAVNKIFF